MNQQRPRQQLEASSTISADKNLMPSMVVKQQRGQLTTRPRDDQRRESKSASQERLDDILQQTREAASDGPQQERNRCGQMFDRDGLVLPRRVPHQHQLGDGQQPTAIRDLNRELKFNQVRGLRVLDQKSELKRAMEKLEQSRRRREAEEERLTRRSSLELRLEERAQRLAAGREGQAGGAEGQAKTEQSGILS